MTRAAVLLAVLAAVALAAAWWRARDGRVQVAPPRRDAGSLAGLVPDDASVLLLELTAPHCAPCATTRRILDEVAAGRPDVAVVAVDVADAADLVTAHRILRAPTTLVVARDGAVLARVSGVPRTGDLEALLDALPAAVAA